LNVADNRTALPTVDVLLHHERYHEALARLRQDAQGQQDQARRYGQEAYALAGLAEFDKAVEVSASALRLDPGQPDAHLALGMAAEANNNMQAAADQYMAALSADSAYAPAYHALGQLLLRANGPEQAANLLQRAAALEPDNWRYRLSVSRLASPNQRRRAEREALRAGLGERPASVALRLQLWRSYLAAPFDRFSSTEPASRATAADLYRALLARPVIVTYLLLAINFLMYLFLETHGGSQNTATLDRYGALDGAAIVHGGQWWRLITPVFLHAGIIHIAVNSLSLYFVGVLYERCVGPWRFLFVYFFAGVAGSVLSLAISNDLAVGASGAIFGIFGATGLYFFRNRALFGPLSRSLVRQVVGLSALNLLLPNLVSGIDGWGHVGGLIGGIVAGAVAGPVLGAVGSGADPAAALAERRSMPAVVGSLVLVTVLLVAVCAAVIWLNPAGV
jgi:rhomboid protease GluP